MRCLVIRIRDRNHWEDWRQEHRGEIVGYWRNYAFDYDDWFLDETSPIARQLRHATK
jgi:hypothetical protein